LCTISYAQGVAPTIIPVPVSNSTVAKQPNSKHNSPAPATAIPSQTALASVVPSQTASASGTKQTKSPVADKATASAKANYVLYNSSSYGAGAAGGYSYASNPTGAAGGYSYASNPTGAAGGYSDATNPTGAGEAASSYTSPASYQNNAVKLGGSMAALAAVAGLVVFM